MAFILRGEILGKKYREKAKIIPTGKFPLFQ